jgi:hypothetical protein
MNELTSLGNMSRAKRVLLTGGVALAASLGTFLAVQAQAAGIPAATALTYTGYLETPDGTPLATEVSVGVSVWNAVTAGKKLCSADEEKLTPVAGRFQVTLPDDCTLAVAANPELWLEVVVDDTSVGRTKLGAVPFAVEAAHSLSASTADGASGALATRLDAIEAGLDTLAGRLDDSRAATISKFDSAADVTISTAEWEWVSGTDATDVAPGRYWAFTTAKANTAVTGCTVAAASCKSYAGVKVSACMKVDGVITAHGSPVYAETSNNPGLGVPIVAFDYFEVTKATAKVQFGMCAAVPGGTPDTWFTRLRSVQSLALPQLD